jgi:hypothetical protein
VEQKFQLQKEVLRAKMPCRTRMSSTLLRHQVHSFMAHGVDPLVEIGGQQTEKLLCTVCDYFSYFSHCMQELIISAKYLDLICLLS